MKTPSKWLVLFTVVSGTFITALNSSIINVSVPSLMKTFHSDLHKTEWVVTAFMIALAVSMPITSWLKERLSYRLLFVLSLFIFSFGSWLCGISNSLEMLIFSRVIQALGGGALAPLSMAIVADTFPIHERGRAFGIWGLGVIIGPAIGPVLGGYLSEVYSWRWIFYINIPMGLVSMLLGWKFLHRKKLETTHYLPFDFPGFISVTAAIVFLLFGLSIMVEQRFLVGSLFVLLGLALTFLFIRLEKKTHAPLWNLQLFKNKLFSSCLLITINRSMALFGGIFLLPLYLQEQMQLTETRSGLVMLPGALILALMMPLVGSLADKGYSYSLTVAGIVILALSFFSFYFVGPETSQGIVASLLLLRGIGIGFLITPLSTVTMAAVKSSELAMASSISNVVQQIGGSLGIAILVLIKVFFFHFAADFNVRAEKAELFSLHTSFIVAGIIVFLSLIPAQQLRKKRHSKAT